MGESAEAAKTEAATVVGSLEASQATKVFSEGFEKSFGDTTTSGTAVQTAAQQQQRQQ